MLDAKGLEAAARKLRNAEKEKFGSWPDADDSKSIAAATVTAYLQTVGREPVAVRELHGPYGWLNGHRALSEDSWELENDPLENSDEYFAIPLYALTDPFAEIGKDGPRSALVATTPAETVDEARTHPLEIYADSYAQMARMGDGKVDCRSVEIDIRQNMIPVTTALATKPAVKDDEPVVEALRKAEQLIVTLYRGCSPQANYNHELTINGHVTGNRLADNDETVVEIRAALAAKDGRS